MIDAPGKVAEQASTNRRLPRTVVGPAPVPRGLGARVRGIPRRLRRPFDHLGMAWRGVLSPTVSDAPSQPAVPQSPIDQRLMRFIILMRGLRNSNGLGTQTLAACARRALERLEREAQPAVAEPVPVRDWNTSRTTLYEEFVRPQRPVVIRGIPAGAWRWTIDWMIGEHGDEPVTLVDSDSVSHNDLRIRDLERPAPNGGPLYMHNHFQLFHDVPARLDDVPLELLANLVQRDIPNTAALFASVREGTGSVLHCANNFNTFMLLEGRKRWVLIDPIHLLLCYPYLSHANFYQLSLVRKEEDAVDLPLYRYCPRSIVDLQPGDCLIVPSWWYHSVKNLDARSLAIAVRWRPFLRGESCSNNLFRVLAEVAGRETPGVRDIHQDSPGLVGTGAARSSWGLQPLTR